MMAPRFSSFVLLMVVLAAGRPVSAQSDAAQSATSVGSDIAIAHRVVGDSLRMAGDLPGAIASYRLAYDATAEGNPRAGADGIAYALATTLALQGEERDDAFKYLIESLSRMTSMQVLHDPDLDSLVSDKRWKNIQDAMLDRLATEVSGTFDRNLAGRLLTIRRQEWVGRYHIMLLFRQSGGQSPDLSRLSQAMSDRHKANESDLIAILDDRGWPQESAVGGAAAYAAANVLTHMDLEARQIYLPMLASACEAGEADWAEYAPSFDRTELESGRLQVYGTQMQMDEDLGRYRVYDLLDPEDVEDRRAEKGLEPLSVQLERFNLSMKRDFGGGQ